MIFALTLLIFALSDLASVLCARKFSFALQGVDTKLLPFHFYLLLFYYLFIIIFKALRLVAAIFMCFFLFGRRRETSALRACCPKNVKNPPYDSDFLKFDRFC